jgi:60 kDa SS-A/Ro ribonucleoprotein
MSYVAHVSPRNTPQTEPLRGQVKNSAGGYCYQIDKFARLDRFLILGCEGGTFYASERKLAIQNANIVLDCAKADPIRTVNRIVAISDSGRAIKNDPAIFALALLASNKTLDTYLNTAGDLALSVMPQVCRTGTHLFQFIEACNELRGWGRGLRTAVSNWYLAKSPDQLAMQVTKYAQRNGWSHRDVLRLCHANTKNRATQDVLQYVAQPDKWGAARRQSKNELLLAVEEVKSADSAKAVIKLVREHGLVREHIPTQYLRDPSVQEALLAQMPMTAMIRNLGGMTASGLLNPLSANTKDVCEKLRSEAVLKKARVHPFSVLLALKTYSQGCGFRGSLTWTPVPQIVDALNDAFYASFGFIERTNKRWLLGIDVSGSMGAKINNTNVSCCEAAGVMAMVALRTEPQCYAHGFAGSFVDLGLRASMDLAAVARKLYMSNFGSTDCSLPMTYALQYRLEVDCFAVYTDNETYAGRKHPSVALREYREKMGIDAKLIVVGMTSTGFSIADPNDPGMLDVVGFDANAPVAMAEFVRG